MYCLIGNNVKKFVHLLPSWARVYAEIFFGNLLPLDWGRQAHAMLKSFKIIAVKSMTAII